MKNAPDAVHWRQHAACTGTSPGLWFGPDGEDDTARATRETMAAQVCARCPVASACLAAAIATDSRHGVWGGTSEASRATLRATRNTPRQRQQGAAA